MSSDEIARIRRTITFGRLDDLRKRCDPLADDVLAAIWAEPSLRREPDLLGACRRLARAGDRAAIRFVGRTNEPPAWVSFERFAKGRDLFLRHGILTLLVGFTVLIDSYAGAKDNKVLVMSGRLRDESAYRRLAETAAFTLACVEEDALRPFGAGHTAALSVRLLHAKVRLHCRARGFDTARFDEPINQEAMCGTLMLFSSGVIFALERLGVHVSAEEKESYHALWRYAGWLMGVDEELLPETFAGECALYEILKDHQYWPDADSRLLFEHAVRGMVLGARSLPLWIKALGGSLMESEDFLRAFTARCVDPRLSSYLGVRTGAAMGAAFTVASVALSAMSRAEARLPRPKALMTRVQGALLRRIVRELVGPEHVRYEDPGFTRPAPHAASA